MKQRRKQCSVQRCIIEVFQSSGQPLFYFAGISEEPHEAFQNWIHRDKTRSEFPIDSLYHVLRVPFVPLHALYCTCVLMDIPHYRVREAHGRSQEMHAQVHEGAIRLTLHQAGRNMHRTGSPNRGWNKRVPSGWKYNVSVSVLVSNK